MDDAAAIILAAGKSTRMKSERPKVLHEICGRPMLWYVLEACRQAGLKKMAVVVGHGKDQVINAFSDAKDIAWVEQREQLGTGHAAMMAEGALGTVKGPVVCIAGDMPLLRGETVAKIVAESRQSGAAVSLATAMLDEPTGYGRIVRDAAGNLAGIVEHNDCTPEQLAIREVNISYYCFSGEHLFGLLKAVDNKNAKGEYYITDTISLARDRGLGTTAIPSVPAEDALGINSRADLAFVARIMQDRIQAQIMDQGVSIVDPASTWIESGAVIGQETTIYPFTYIAANAEIGERLAVGPHALVTAEGIQSRVG